MIPTTATSSSLSTSSASTPSAANSSQQNLSATFKGIAALILEGRAISEDEFQPQTRPSPIVANASTYKDVADMTSPFYLSNSCGGGRQSPGPSTSRAAASSTHSSLTSRHVINITMNPQVFGCSQSSVFDDIIEDPAYAETTTHQRWTQKLCQLRQASPAATSMSRECGLYEPQVAVEAGEPELVALAINPDTANADKAGDFEIVRRVMLSRSNMSTSGGSASSSPGSTDNFLHSLQSLATTCLRGGSPVVETGLRYAGPNASAVGSIGAPKYNIFRATLPPTPRCSNPFSSDVPGSASSSGSGIQSPHNTCAWSPQLSATSASSSGSGIETTRCNRREQFRREVTPKGRMATPTATRTSTIPVAAAANTVKSSTGNCSHPQQGPHCEQFLRKMGLAKGEAAEAEDHFCDMSYVNITCSRWRAYCLKMEAMIQRGEPVCIEVYLGPVRHKILLEQWILTQKDKVPPPTMTLPSLCSAIRSQLYFSQISAWCDLIKKSDKTIYDTERVIFPTPTGAAGDLATATPGTSPNTSSSNSSTPPTSHTPRRPRLNIFYRIKQYDSTACFNSKPNVHNFPNVIISDSCSISVCLKSLPRLNGGIPKLGAATNGNAADSNTTTSAFAGVVSTTPATPKTSRHALAAVNVTAASPTKNCDTQKISAAAPSTLCGSSDSAASQSRPHKCTFYIDEEEDLQGDELAYEDYDDECTNGSFAGDSSNSSISCSLSHREKQLMKYRKRMLKRDKKSTRKPTEQQAANGNREQPMEQGDEDDVERNEDEEKEKAPQKCSSKNSHHECPPSRQVQEKHSTHPLSSASTATTHNVAMISTGTQTQTNCCQCGSEKALVCLNCDRNTDCVTRKILPADEMDSMDSCSISSSEIIHTPRNNAELLLQAIQRTPKAAKKNKKQSLRQSPPPTIGANSSTSKNNNQSIGCSSASVTSSQSGSVSGCQNCKRQKTQHNFETATASTSGSGGTAEDSEEIVCDEDDDEDDGRVNKVIIETAPNPLLTVNQQDHVHQILDEECFNSSTKLTPYIDKCSMNNNSISCLSASSASSCKSTYAPPPYILLNDTENTASNRSRTPPNSETASADAILFNCEGSFKTPTNAQQQTQHYQQHKQTPKPTLLQFSAVYHGGAAGDGNQTNGSHYEATPPGSVHSPLLLRKGLPKVNLTPIFCNPSANSSAPQTNCFTSSPIPIGSCPVISAKTNSFCFDHVAITAGGNLATSTSTATAIVDNNNIPVQKSFSAPTLPNSPSPSLSPRFAKQAAIYKRRSRHLSDRSDRSSLGSDEQISDEDLECGAGGLYSPATSPMKMRSRTAAIFGNRSLLGNLEESLLQRRLMPKIEVLGFKVLLGASGGFCPTQLTIPAASYFYELHGASLSTPYVCEIRLPRKGYSVPRAGTVQATLLNPMGTVVRMFVIPYDMRDMPPLHQTFIRQRVLAEASTNETLEAVENSPLTPVCSNRNNNNNNSVGYQNGSVNGFGGDGSKDCAYNTTNYNSNDSNTNNKNKYRLSPNGGLHGDSNLGHFISAEHMKRLRYSIHLRFQTSRSGRLSLHTDIRLLISRRTDCDTAAAHAKGVLEAPNDLVTDTVMPTNPKYSARQENPNKI